MRTLRPLVIFSAGLFVLSLSFPAFADQDLFDTCMACHGPPKVYDLADAPLIHGQNKNYLERQLNTFRPDAGLPASASGRRYHPVMNKKAAAVPREDISFLAGFISRFPCKQSRPIDAPSPPPPKAAIRCFACHGEGGRSRISHIPRLAGQKKSYLLTQLQAFMTDPNLPIGPARIRGHRMMTREGSYISAGDVDRLAEYFSGQACR